MRLIASEVELSSVKAYVCHHHRASQESAGRVTCGAPQTRCTIIPMNAIHEYSTISAVGWRRGV